MMTGRIAKLMVAVLALGLAAGLGAATAAGPGCPHGQGGHGRGGSDGDHRRDAAGFHYLFAHRAEIRRTVTEVPGGIESVTESDVPAVARAIQEHVEAMYRRVKEGRPIHARDPLFAELFENADKITMQLDRTAAGVRVRETSADARTMQLIRRHAEVVSAFLANGHVEMMRDHGLPPARD